VLRPIYLSLTLQMATVVLCLAFSGRLLWLRVYTLAFVCVVLLSIAISAMLPAAGAWPHYGLTGADSRIVPAVSTSWPVFYGLRDGSFRLLVAVGSEGIITFPSVHAALAIIVIAALWPMPALRFVAIAINLLMLLATPIDGSHYFVDIAARRRARRCLSRRGPGNRRTRLRAWGIDDGRPRAKPVILRRARARMLPRKKATYSRGTP
jgi:hypothetical protein